MIRRREFLQIAAATPGLRGQTANPWSGPVIDIHHHWRR
jgi:hypothetical protein